MNMNHMDTSMDMPSSHAVIFNNNHNTPLFSKAWTPSSSGSYAGTCIFLIVLAIIARVLVAFKVLLEQHWLAAHLNRRYISIAGKSTEAGCIEKDPDAKLASLVSAQGVEESVRVIRRTSRAPMPWRFSVDVPRAGIFLCITGVSYLLMLAVMTLNVGYFCSVLAGAFVGELVVGRYIQYDHDH